MAVPSLLYEQACAFTAIANGMRHANIAHAVLPAFCKRDNMVEMHVVGWNLLFSMYRR